MQNLIKVLIPRQLFMMLLLSTGLLNHVILIPNLLNAGGRDSWLSVLLSFPIALFFLWLIYFIVNNSPQEGFFAFVEKRAGKVVSFLLSLPVVLFLFTSAFITIRDLLIWLNSYFLSDASVTLINFILIVVCLIITVGGVKYMAISSGVLLPIVMIFGIFIAITNTSIKDPSLLFPLLSEGYKPVWKGMIYALAGLLEVYIVVLLQPFAQEKVKFHQLFILLVLLTVLMLGPLTASIMEFGPEEATHLRYPAYEQWRVLNIGDYISHLDFFALFQWLSGAVIRVGLFIYLLSRFFSKRNKHYKPNRIVAGVVYLLLFLLVYARIDTYWFYESIYRYFLPGCMVFLVFQTLISAFLLIVFKKRDEKNGGTGKQKSS
ncbi:spore germination protein [Sutcliffiella horikoshii]|uniref:GerAB/ArcD/ProY family transporter n=1 Tax=Sutcliffiella horikoshii TaxID=79883 RepID=UPI002040AA16|nr:endospore germination permease [Sutcliffiella horikoshii]MCM3617748.1 spore germination protein [Sutcliffiella horikoshii]